MQTLDLSWLNPDGSCGARRGKGIVTVRGGVPGDRVEVEITRERGRNASGEVRSLIEPSPDRREAPCPWDANCGGCDLAALTPEAQLAAKARMVQHTLRLDETPQIIGSPRAIGHRARMKVGLKDQQVGYRRARSHDIVNIDVCRIARPEVVDALNRLRSWLEEHGPLPFPEVEIRSDGERAVYAFEGSRRNVPSTLASIGDVAVGGRSVFGDATLTLNVLGLELRASPPSFYQVNLEGNELLAGFVRDTVLASNPARVLDLYAGIGNLDLSLAVAGVPVTAVELEGAAIRDLAYTADKLGVSDKVAVQTMPAERYDLSRDFFDVLVLDPPRSGAPGVLAKALMTRPHTVVYVSCNVASAARDIRPLTQAGYRLEEVRCYDLFPDTHHIETVLVLRR
ncbi:MAG: class I SAM-dependent RNA methyltransferase [Proteobacteria bacterium]|nr:class I SAM-dependent RNA methyltransferase [Pseudomonadota bacterium]